MHKYFVISLLQSLKSVCTTTAAATAELLTVRNATMSGLDSRHESSLLFVSFVHQPGLLDVGGGACRNPTTTHIITILHSTVMFGSCYTSLKVQPQCNLITFYSSSTMCALWSLAGYCYTHILTLILT